MDSIIWLIVAHCDIDEVIKSGFRAKTPFPTTSPVSGIRTLSMDYLSHVNLLQGTASTHDFSTGNTLPLVARPWGMHHWTPQTGDSPWTFHCGARHLRGVRLTHQPSPWMRDYANVTLLPFTGDYQANLEFQSSGWRVEDAVFRPDHFRAELLRYGVILEMSPTERGAVFTFSRQRTATGPLRLRFDFDGEHDIGWRPGSRVVSGSTANQFQGEHLKNFALHLHGEFSIAPVRFERTARGGCLTFPDDTERVELRLAASFIGTDQARLTHDRELAGRSLDDVRLEGAAVWNDLLGRLRVNEPDLDKVRTFYSCAYRTLLFPRFLDEIDADGRVVHYSPYDGAVHPGPLCTDHGFWDAYRTVYPLLALVWPDKLGRIMQGWLNGADEAGWAPKWPSPGFRDCMIGTHFDSVVADLAAKDIGGWDVEKAFAHIWKSASRSSDDPAYGRPELDVYLKHGYVPADLARQSVACTQDYTYGDWCVAQVARLLGKDREADALIARSLNHRNLFDPAVGFMRARRSDGAWDGPFREFQWGGGYIEGGPWQYAFNAPHDIDGLATLYGGPEKLCRKIDRMLATPPRFEIGTYPFEIHEMTEMAVANFGQYAHSNQPVHNTLFLYALCGEPEKTTHWVHRVANELYSPDAFPGDEDNGEMAAWYLFAAMGIYPFCPGRPDYVRFRGTFEQVEIHRLDLPAPLRLVADTVTSNPIVSHQHLLATARTPVHTVVAYGTSLTAGGRWVRDLAALLDDRHSGGVRVINSGLSGFASNTGLARLPSRVLAHRPDTVLIEFSMNDAFDYEPGHFDHGITPEKSRENLNLMIDAILEANPAAEIILQTMNPVRDVPGVRDGATKRPTLDAYYDVYRDIARVRGLRLLDHHANWSRLHSADPEVFARYIPDGVHPSEPASSAITFTTVRDAFAGKPEPCDIAD